MQLILFFSLIAVVLQTGCFQKDAYEIGKTMIGNSSVADLKRHIQEHGDIDINIKRKDEKSFLEEASHFGDLSKVQLLIEQGADVRTGSPLKYAVLGKHYEVAKYLITQGAQVVGQKSTGLRPIDEALFSLNPKMVDLFAENGALKELQSAGPMGTALELLAEKKGSESLLRHLVTSYKLSLDYGRYQTPLIASIREKNTPYALELIRLGAEVNVFLERKHEGGKKLKKFLETAPMSALSYAAVKGLESVVDSLLNAGADPNLADAKAFATPLYWATAYGRTKIAKKLIEHGAYPGFLGWGYMPLPKLAKETPFSTKESDQLASYLTVEIKKIKSAQRMVSNIATESRSIDVASGHFCKVDSGQLLCRGHLPKKLAKSPKDFVFSSKFIELPGFPQNVTQFSSASHPSHKFGLGCALANGQVYCYGFNDLYSLTDSHPLGEPVMKAVKIKGLPSKIKKISVGRNHVLAMTSNGEMWCWGNNNDGNCGRDVGEYRDFSVLKKPQRIISSGVTDVAAGFGASCIVHKGKGQCFGDNKNGLLGVAPNTSKSSYKRHTIKGLESGVQSLSLSDFKYACAVVSDQAKCWGQVAQGVLGNGRSDKSGFEFQLEAKPVLGLEKEKVQQVATGSFAACAKTSSGKVYCWGDNSMGLLGTGKRSEVYSRAQWVEAIQSPATQVIASERNVCVTLATGKNQCWGNVGDFQAGFSYYQTQTDGETHQLSWNRNLYQSLPSRPF